MPYNELSFWVLFTPLLIFYWFLPHRLKTAFLLATSYLYYSLFDWRFCLIIFISTLVDYTSGRAIHRWHGRGWDKLALTASLVTNFTLLITFKYFYKDLAAIGFQALSEPESWESYLAALSFPIGVSFYTFQSLSYTIDCYRRKVPACRSLLTFSLYVSFFPQLLAGPIERARHLIPQLSQPKCFQWQNLEQGAYLILLGLVKKNFYAAFIWYKLNESLELGVSSGPLLLTSAVFMAFYVYFDFSGYCDIGRGLARCLGINISINFRPFLYAKNPADLWARWNFTLTYWVRDYFVIPLSRRLPSRFLTDVVVLLAMLLIGLWHGATIGWLSFGLSQGVFIVLYRNLKRHIGSKIDRGLWALSARLITYGSLLTMGLIHFTIEYRQPWSRLGLLFHDWLDTRSLPLLALTLIIMLPILIFEFLQEHSKNYDFIFSSQKLYKLIYLSVGLALLYQSHHYYQAQFVYFQF